MFHIIIVSSLELDAIREPLLFIDTLFTQSVCPLIVYTQYPELVSHIFIV